MLIFCVWPELVKLPNLHWSGPTLCSFCGLAQVGGREKSERWTQPHPHSQSHHTSFFAETERRRGGRRLGFSKPSPWPPSSSSNRPDPRGHPLPPAPATILHCFVDSKVQQRHLLSPILVAPPEAPVVPASNKSTPAPSGTTSQVRLIFPALRMSIWP